MLCLAPLLLLSTVIGLAQTADLTGVVIDARTNQPLSGVLVVVEGQPISAKTDASGHFALRVSLGDHTLSFALVGYAHTRVTIAVGHPALPPLRIELPEGAGAVTETVTVSGVGRADQDRAPGGATLHGRDLMALRGVALDDPLRALQSAPAVSATDDFYSEFAVRGQPFRNTQLIVDGVPSRYLMHAVHGVTDGGSIAMINTDAVGLVSLMPGAHPQRFGRRSGAQIDMSMREGDRSHARARGGLSGTSATALAEGPLAGGRGSWLASARRSYLDLLLERIDDDNSLAFGFSDAQGKAVLDVTPSHQLQLLVVAGGSKFEETPEDLGPNDEARIRGRSWLTTASWRYTPSRRMTITQRLFATGLAFDSINNAGASLDDSRSSEAGWRADATLSPHPALLVDIGGDAIQLAGQHTVRRALNDAPEVGTIHDYRATERELGAYAQLTFTPSARLSLTPGIRADRRTHVGEWLVSPWGSAEWRVLRNTVLTAAAGVHRQFADLEQTYGTRAPSTKLRPERAMQIDVSASQVFAQGMVVHVTGFRRIEEDVLWSPGAEPRLLPDGRARLGRGDAPWVNALEGDACGLEIVLRRDSPDGFSGWASYGYARHRYTDTLTQESFWSDFDQRHAVSLFGYYRVTNRTSLGTKFRFGSNYPRVGYITARTPSAGTTSLFGGDAPLFFALASERNTLRLPAYSRWDIRADRTFTWLGRRATLFVEIANVLNRRNVRNVPYGVDRTGRVLGGTDALMPILPSAGFVIEL